MQLAVYSATIGVHFFLMGAWPAGMSAELNTIRTLVSMHTRKLWVMTVFIILTLVLGLAKLTFLLARTYLRFGEIFQFPVRPADERNAFPNVYLHRFRAALLRSVFDRHC